MGQNRKLEKDNALAVDDRATPLEPRVMLDANLTIDLGGTEDLTELLVGLAQAFDQQADDASAILDSLEQAGDSALALLNPLLDGQTEDLTAITDTVTRIQDALDELRSGLAGEIDTLFSSGFQSNLESNANAALSGVTVSASDLSSIFDSESVLDGTLMDELISYLEDQGSSDAEGDASIVLDQVVGSLESVTSALTLTLTDIVVDGETLVAFSDGSDGAVTATVNLLSDDVELTADLTDLLSEALPGLDLPFALSTTVGIGSSFSFDISAAITVDSGSFALESLEVHVDNFEFDDLLTFGGDLSLSGGSISATLGLLETSIDSVTLASFALAIQGAEDLDLGGEIDFSGGLDDLDFTFYGTTTGADLTMGVLVAEAGSSDFAVIVDDQEYDLISVAMSASIDFGGSTQDFGADVSVSAVLSSSGGTDILTTMIDSASLGLDLDLSTVVGLSDEAKAIFENLVSALATMSTSDLIEFLNDTGTALAGVLTDTLFDIDIPFTDISLSEAAAAISDVFADLVTAFIIEEASLGFGDTSDALVLTNEVVSFDGSILTEAQMDLLANYSELTFAVQVAGDYVLDITIDLTSEPALQDTSLSVYERMTALAALLSSSVLSTTYGFTFTTSKLGALTIGTTKSEEDADSGVETYNTLAITGGTQIVDDGTGDDYSLALLGFGEAALDDLSYVVSDSDSTSAISADEADDDATSITESFLGFTYAQDTVELGTLVLDDIAGVTSLRFTFTVDGVDRWVDVTSDTGWTDLATLIDDFNTALASEGLGVTVDTNTDGDGLSFSIDADEDRKIEISIDDGAILRATSLEGLIAWANSALQDVWEGAALALTDDGELIFQLPQVSASTAITEDDEIYFTADEIGFGLLGDTSLSALLTAELSGAMTASFGIDLAALGSDIIDAGTDALNGASNLGSDLIDTVLENAFFTDVSISLTVNAIASDITGTADLGIASIVIGGDDASQNYVAFGLQLYASMIGTDSEGAASDRVSFGNIWDAVVNTIGLDDAGDAEATMALGLDGLIGRLDLLGTIVTGGEGLALASDGEAATSSGDLQIVDGVEYSGDDVLAQMVARFGDVTINVGTISGLNEDIIDGLGLTILDLFDYSETTSLAIIAENEDAAAALEGLAALEGDDILDALVSIANMLVVVGEALEDNLPFLSQDIPLLNFSILDTISFSADFLEMLQDIRNDPQAALDELDSLLEGYFGDDTVELTWDEANATIVFGLSFQLLDDYSETLPFQLDLSELLGDSLADILGEDLAATVSGLVDASGDGELVFDPLLSFDFVFGLDLSALLAEPDTIAAASTAISALATVGSVNLRPDGGAELRVSRVNADGDLEKVDIDLDGAETIEEVVSLVDAAVKSAFGDTVSFSYDETTGVFTLTDSLATSTDDTGAEALTGAAEAESEEVDGLQTIALSGLSDYAAAYEFDIQVGDARVTVSIDAVAGRTEEEFVEAVNAALSALDMDRSDVFDTGVPGTTVVLSQLVHAVTDGAGNVSLVSTGFDAVLGYDTYSFALKGVDTSSDIEFALTDLGGANFAAAMGLDGEGTYYSGTITSEVIYEAVEDGSIRIYLDTEETGITLSMTAGVTEGLNLSLAIGPVTVSVSDGYAYIGAADGSGDPAYISFSIVDIDGDEHEGQYDLAHLFEISQDDSVSLTDLFDLDISIGINVSLPLSDSIGIFDPETDGVFWNVSLVNIVDGKSWHDLLGSDSYDDVFEGALIDLMSGSLSGIYLPDVTFPDLSNLLDSINILALLNDPVLVLDGLDMILDMVQSSLQSFLGAIDLPLVGDNLTSALTFFDEFRIDVLETAMSYAETPQDDGTLPTTIDLINNFLNDALNDLLGTSGTTYLQAYLNTDGGTEDSYVYATLNFSQIIFSESMNLGFDLGIPGFELELADAVELLVQLEYSVNIGFGYDKNGFFLLNDTDDEELSIDFTVTAENFEASMELFGILGITATTNPDTSDDLYSSLVSEYADQGEISLTASLYVDLYGDQGLLILDPATQGDAAAISSAGVYRDFSGVTATDGGGDVLTYERVVYISQLDTGNMIDFGFEAQVNVILSLQGDVLDPTTGEPLLIDGVQFIPSVATELEFRAVYTISDGLEITALAFHDMRIDLSAIEEAILDPIFDPLREFIDPVAEYFSFIKETAPFSFIYSALATAFPILGMIDSIASVIVEINDFLNELDETGGVFVYGDYDYYASLDDLSSGEAELGSVDSKSVSTSLNASLSSSTFGIFGNSTSGVSVEIPLLTDPFSILDIFLGNFEDVGLVEVHLTLFNLPQTTINIADEVFGMIGLPGWVADIIESAFKATVSLKLYGGITVGYDLSGVVNFVETMDPERLLDGIYIESGIGSIIDVNFGFSISLSVYVAGVDFDGYAYFRLGFNDPNGDGKLRFPELIAVIDAALDADSIGDMLGLIFVGDAGVDLSLSLWVKIPLIFYTYKKSWEVFDFSTSINFGGNPVTADLSTDISETGGTAILNIGSRAGASMSAIDEDGDDNVTITGPNSPYKLTYTQDGKTVTAEIDMDAAAIIIPAGSGNNRIDLSAVHEYNGSTATTITYTGSGEDEIILPSTGVHVVFAGDGDDTITATDAEGVYIIFGEEGSDTINIDGGTVIYFGADDYGMRDLFINAFASGGVTVAKVLELLGLEMDADGNVTVDQSVSGDNLDLQALMDSYTASTQNDADDSPDTVILGAGGTKIVLTGAGADLIEIESSGDVTIMSGAGSDTISASGDNVYIEGGAGGDLISVDGAQTEVWGWGAAAGESGNDGTQTVRSLALKDGQDIITGGSGSDTIYGQLGDDILQGGAGEDDVYGGKGDDLVTGGTFKLTTSSGTTIDLLTMTPGKAQTSSMILSVLDADDGDDRLYGGDGSDIMIGGGGNDTLEGGIAADLLVGDFADVYLSAGYVATGVTSTYVTSSRNGTDSLAGGEGNDILIAGGSTSGVEVIEDLDGSNVVVGDFAKITGAQILSAVTGIVSIASDLGGADMITTGRGNDLILGGEGADTISAGLGADMVLGDLGTLSITDGTLTGLSDENDGDDVITFGADDSSHYGSAAPSDLKDVVIGGLGSDTISSAAADLVAIGDAGTVTMDAIALNALRSYQPLGSSPTALEIAEDEEQLNLISMLVTQIETAGTAEDGDDSITSSGGEGIIALGGGSDVAELADGVNYVLGDDGKITIAVNDDYTGHLVEITSADTAASSSNDRIVTGAGDDIIVAGEGADTVETGEGSNLVLGDSGTITSDTRDTTAPVYALTSAADEGDGDDSVISGSSDDAYDLVILGGGSDIADLGHGTNIALGDSGQIDVTIGTGYDLLSSDPSIGGDDDITSGSGDDYVILGVGNDVADLGRGANFAVGDNGEIHDALATGYELFSTDAGIGGGKDSVTGASGDDAVILGDAEDQADLGDGDNLAIGDNGRIAVTRGTLITLTSDETGTGAGDTITSGAGQDAILGGEGGDSIAAGEGSNFILGDGGSITLDTSAPAAPVYDLVSAYDVNDGNDTVSTGSQADALDIIVLGAGDDSLTMGDGTNIAIGDSGEVHVTIGSGYDLLSTNPGTGGNDSVTGGVGADAVILGDGSDTADLSDGSDIAVGDNGEVHFDIAGGHLELYSTSPSIGGDDSITSGLDMLIAIGGVGADTVQATGGTNWLLGDNGQMTFDATGTVSVSTSDEDLGGNDVLQTGSGDDLIIGGTGADRIDAGNGTNRGLGDSGSYTLDDTTGADDGDLVSAYLSSDGDDSLTSGEGNDFFILGGGADGADLGNGENRVIGDSGEIHWADTHLTEMTTTDTNTGAADTITSGAGADAILAGDGGDEVYGGAGDNAIIGDQGILVLDAGALVNVVRSATTFDESEGGADSIVTTDGDDVILAGAAGDTVSSGAGEDAIAGDNATWISSHVTGEGSFTATLLDFGGDDVIDSGTGSDMVMGNLGNDDIYVDAGEDVVFGDDAVVTFINRSDVRTLVLTNEDLGGDDTISAGDMSGDNMIFGQAGADSIMGGGTDDLIIGDIVELTFTDPSLARPGQSAVDRVDYLIGTRIDLGFDDRIDAGAGNDFVVAGFGSDTVNGGSGQDFLIGDTIIYQRTFTETDTGLFEVILLDTNYAYITGGYDYISGDEGNDIMIGNLGGDLFFGNTREDVIFSDGYAGEYHGKWTGLLFEGETAFRTLWKSNFAGPGAIDVVSRAQQDDSIGSPFDLVPDAALPQFNLVIGELDDNFISDGFDGHEALFFVNQVMDYLSSEKVVGALAVMLNSGADRSVMDDALRAGIAGQFAGVWNLDAPEFELVIRQIIAFLLERVEAANENQAPSEAA